MNKEAHLRRLLTGPTAARAAGARDGLSARVVEECGFDVVWASSFEISAARALPDMSLLTMTDYLEAAARMNAATSLPVLADCDTGFGSELNVAYLVREYQRAGIAGVCIEDKIYPKRNSFLADGQVLEDVGAFAAKIRTAKDVQFGEDFVVVARTEALIAGMGMPEALLRAGAYVDAGADAVLIHSKSPSHEEVDRFLGAWQRRTPVVVVPTTYYHWSIDEASAAGVSLVIYANHGLRSSVSAMREALTEIRAAGSSAGIENRIASLKQVFTLTAVDEWAALEK